MLRPSRFQNGVNEAFAMAVTGTLVGERDQQQKYRILIGEMKCMK
jgi:hypothetical protein